MKKKKTRIWLVVIAGAILLILLVFKPFSGSASGFDYETVTVERGNIVNTVTATGTVEAVTTVEVGTQVSGIIEDVFIDFNDDVKRGQILAKLDEVPLVAQLEQSQASVDQAQAEFDYQEATYSRMNALYEKQLISKSEYDQAIYNYNRAKASLNNAKSAYDRSKVNLDYATITSPIDGVVLNRAVEEGQTVASSFNTPTLFTIVNDLTQMEVQTSVDEADIGNVKQGQRVEFTVDAYPDSKFEAIVSQVRLQPVITNNVVTYTVILDAPNPEKKLMPGMTASATIYVNEKINALRVSGRALRFTPDPDILTELISMPEGMPTGMQGGMGQMPQGFDPQNLPNPPEGFDPSQFDPSMFGFSGGGFPGMSAQNGMQTVWIFKNDSVRPAFVTTGIDNGSEVEIISGLEEGDQVLTNISRAGTEDANSRSENGFGPPPGGGFPF